MVGSRSCVLQAAKHLLTKIKIIFSIFKYHTTFNIKIVLNFIFRGVIGKFSRIKWDPGPVVGYQWSMLWSGSKLYLIVLLSFRREGNIINLNIFFIFLVIKFKLLFFDFQLLKVNGFGSEKTFVTWNFNESRFFKKQFWHFYTLFLAVWFDLKKEIYCHFHWCNTSLKKRQNMLET